MIRIFYSPSFLLFETVFSSLKMDSDILGAYTHPRFRNGKRDWCKLIKRKKPADTLDVNNKTKRQNFATTSRPSLQINFSPEQQYQGGNLTNSIHNQSIFYKSNQDMSNQQWMQVHDELLLAYATSTVATWLPSTTTISLNDSEKNPSVHDLINEIIYTFDDEIRLPIH